MHSKIEYKGVVDFSLFLFRPVTFYFVKQIELIQLINKRLYLTFIHFLKNSLTRYAFKAYADVYIQPFNTLSEKIFCSNNSEMMSLDAILGYRIIVNIYLHHMCSLTLLLLF